MEALAAGHPGQDPQMVLPAEPPAMSQAFQAQAWGDITSSAPPQLGHVDVAQLGLLQQPQPHQTMQLTADQLAALTGALNGTTDLSALTGALGANPELLQRLMVAPADPQPAEQPTMNIELPRAPDLISNSYMLDVNASAAPEAQLPAAASEGPDSLHQAAMVLPDGAAINASLPQLQEQQGMMLAGDGAAMPTTESTQDAIAAAVAAAAAAGGTSGLSEELQLQLQRGVKRKAGESGEPQADSDVADILLAMAGNPALKKLAQQQAELAAVAASGGLPVADSQFAGHSPAVAAGDNDAAVAHAVDAAAQLQASLATEDAGTAGGQGDMQTATIIDQNGQQVTVSMGGAGLTDAAGNPLAGLDFSALAASGALSVSTGIPGLSLDMQSLGGAGMLQLADLSRLQGLQAGGAQGYAALPGMQTLQLVQLPMQGDLSALQQTAAGYGAADEHGRPLKRVKEEGGLSDGAEDAAGADGGMAGVVGDGGGADAAGGVPGLEGQTLDLQQAADANAAAHAAAAAIGTVVNVNGVNMLIPAAPQLQLQLTSGDPNMQDQLLALQQHVQLAQLPLMGGLGGVQLPAAGLNLATATPDQLQSYLQTQQQIQQLQLQHQLQLMQLQLAGQQGIMLTGGGPRILGLDGDGSGHMVRRHGVLPERLVTRDMLKQVFHLPIEEAAKHLGIGQTMLKHYCRKFGIPRWPYRKRQSVVQLINSIENYAADKPQIVQPALDKLRSFLAQIDEDPNIDLDGPIKRLRQAFFKEAYKARVRKQQNDSGEDRRGGRPGGGRSDAWLENLCQAIVDSNSQPMAHTGHDMGGLDMHGEDGDDMTADAGADELAAAMHHHAQHHVQGHLQHQALDHNALAMAAAAAQLAGVGGLPGQEGLGAAGLDDAALVAAAAQAQAQQEQLAALQAAVEQQQQQQQGE